MQTNETIPHIAFGTWKMDPEQAEEAVCAAIRAGYRQIDTATAYANEPGVGTGIAKSGARREELMISGKLWTTKRSYDAAIKACKRSLKSLGLLYFDQYLIHWPAPPALFERWQEMNAETWRAMEALLQEGTVRSIGVCNCKPRHLEALKKTALVSPAVNQIEFHPGYFQAETAAYCKMHKIAIEAWSPLGSGTLLTNPVLARIAAHHQREVAQICLRWCVQHGALPVSKTVSPERMRSNLQVFDFTLSEEEMEEIDRLPLLGYSGLDPDTVTQFG